MNKNQAFQVYDYKIPIFWGTKDPRLFAAILDALATQTSGIHFADNMFCWQRTNSMFRDTLFVNVWKKNIVSDNDRTIVWRRYLLALAAWHCAHLEGDFVECGCYEGVGSKIMIDYLGDMGRAKHFWLYDLFEYPKNALHHSMPHHGPNLHAEVVKRFAGYPNVHILKGLLPDTLERSPEKIALLHLDLNNAPSEIACLERLFDRIVPNGILILDDYEYLYYHEQKEAEDAFFAKRGYRVFPLPTSQGIVLKREEKRVERSFS